MALTLLIILVFPTMSKAEEGSEMKVSIISKNITIRGDELTLLARVNNGAENMLLRWLLPPGFQLVNGSLETMCEKSICEDNITVKVTENTNLGPQTIGVDIEYA